MSQRIKSENHYCAVCDKKLKLKPFHLKRYKGPFTCSRACRGELVKFAYKGRNNPNSKYKSEIEKFFAIRTKDIKRRARNQNIDFNLNNSYLFDLYSRQNGLCY